MYRSGEALKRDALASRRDDVGYGFPARPDNLIGPVAVANDYLLFFCEASGGDEGTVLARHLVFGGALLVISSRSGTYCQASSIQPYRTVTSTWPFLSLVEATLFRYVPLDTCPPPGKTKGGRPAGYAISSARDRRASQADASDCEGTSVSCFCGARSGRN